MSAPAAFSTRYRVRFDDIDAAGIVYYPRYLHLCHVAFEELIDARSPVPYAELITGHRRGFPTVAVTGNFMAPLAYGDEVRIDVSVTRVGQSSMDFQYVFTRARDGRECFRATLTTVFTDLDRKCAVPLPADLRAVLRPAAG